MLIQEHLKTHGESSDEDGENGDLMVHLGSGFYLYKALYDKLYAHQREGILFLWNLYKKRRGGILGDDMGFVLFETCSDKTEWELGTSCNILEIVTIRRM